MRGFKTAVLAAALGVIPLVAQYLLLPEPPPEPGDYFLTELARAQIGWVSIPLALGFAVVLGYRSLASPGLIGLAMVVVHPLTAIYEAAAFPGSHNLIPFEFVYHALLALPLMAGVAVGRHFARRSRSQPASEQ